MTTKTHGGKRAGAGRKHLHGEPTVYVPLRLPQSLVARIDGLEGDTRTMRIITALKSLFSPQ